MLASADAAREISRELLALDQPGPDGLGGPARAAGRDRAGTARETDRHVVRPVLGSSADSVRDFYAFLGQVLSRYDLDSAEYTGFKDLLLDYVESITEESSLLSPRIEVAIGTVVAPSARVLMNIDAADDGLAGAAADPTSRMQRSRGHDLADWAGLRAWFVDATAGQSGGPASRRDAARSAVAAGQRQADDPFRQQGLSRRRDLLRLAGWFDDADDDDRRTTCSLPPSAVPARHLGIAPDADRGRRRRRAGGRPPRSRFRSRCASEVSRAARGRASGIPDDYAPSGTSCDEQAPRSRAARSGSRRAAAAAAGPSARRRHACRSADPADARALGASSELASAVAPIWTSLRCEISEPVTGIRLRSRPAARATRSSTGRSRRSRARRGDRPHRRGAPAGHGSVGTTTTRASWRPNAAGAARLLLAALCSPPSPSGGVPADPQARRELARTFGQFLGYRLVIEPGFARLFKAGPGQGPGRLERPPARRSRPRMYAYLALAGRTVTAPSNCFSPRSCAGPGQPPPRRGSTWVTATTRRAAGPRSPRSAAAGLAGACRGEGSVSPTRATATPKRCSRSTGTSRRMMATGRSGEPLPLRNSSRRPPDPAMTVPGTRTAPLGEDAGVYVDELTDDERDWLRREPAP